MQPATKSIPTPRFGPLGLVLVAIACGLFWAYISEKESPAGLLTSLEEGQIMNFVWRKGDEDMQLAFMYEDGSLVFGAYKHIKSWGDWRAEFKRAEGEIIATYGEDLHVVRQDTFEDIVSKSEKGRTPTRPGLRDFYDDEGYAFAGYPFF